MSDHVSRARRRWSQSRLARETGIAALAIALVGAAGLAACRAEGSLQSATAAAASLMAFEPPRWIHNLADLLQVATPLVAIAVWGTSRRKRR